MRRETVGSRKLYHTRHGAINQNRRLWVTAQPVAFDHQQHFSLEHGKPLLLSFVVVHSLSREERQLRRAITRVIGPSRIRSEEPVACEAICIYHMGRIPKPAVGGGR